MKEKIIRKSKLAIKKILKYAIIFFITMLSLLCLLVFTAKIPKELLTENYKESTNYFLNPKYLVLDREIDALSIKRKDTYKFIYGDAMLMNIMYCIDSNNALKSVMEAKYYSTFGSKDISYDFNKLVYENKEGNVQYMRYWHGSMSILRPLFVFFNIEQIYFLNAIVISLLAIILLIMLIKTKIKELVLAYILGLVMCSAFMVPLCLEYFWTFLIMFIVSILGIRLDKKRKNLNILFLLSGMITCYLDFLSTETITLLVPLLIVLVIRYKEKRVNNFKEGIKFALKSAIFWGIGYVGMWISKWILASLILNVNALDYVRYNMLSRMLPGGISNLPIRAINTNILMLFPINLIKNKNIIWILLACIVIMEIILIRKKHWKQLWFPTLLIMIAIVPYIRYVLLASHSFTHFFFTYRAQITSIMAISLAIVYSINTNKKEE